METKERVSGLEDHLGYWLRYVSNHVSLGFTKRLGANGVTVAEWVVLRQMYDGGVTSPGDVARKTGLTRGAISKLIDRILAKGLVTRAEAARDRRFQEIKLTARGRKLVPRLAALADENDGHFFSHLSGPQRDEIIRLLREIVKIHRLGKVPVE